VLTFNISHILYYLDRQIKIDKIWFDSS